MNLMNSYDITNNSCHTAETYSLRSPGPNENSKRSKSDSSRIGRPNMAATLDNNPRLRSASSLGELEVRARKVSCRVRLVNLLIPLEDGLEDLAPVLL